ncbi:cache domain-containing protein [Neptuniibacter sp. 2_MG-2023]|uniref:cache domain-containing protein n=1 Tax=Neptuniibacter sp. 2_MG-2023 TaxID=3062671 RepID=UPI0026E2D123|nr:cache domain-containing protein [Neptuniibacter sp. 2_MG-2023]MDO6512979.1 cache domain-containing protein [Neptuniibacter sp. 2_MG-2023]
MRLSISKALALGIVALQVITVCVILASSYLSTEQVLIGHAQQLMRNLSREVIDRSEEFLAPARSAVSLTGRLAHHQVVSSEKPDEMEQYFFDQLILHPHIAGIYYGNLEGGFHFVRRSTGEAAYQIKRVLEGPQGRLVSNRWFGDDHRLIKAEEDPSDLYDPRTRPWFRKAIAEEHQIWTDPYLFFTSNTPGITVASPVIAKSGDVLGVVGVDIDLSSLSDFLGFLELSEHASALILNNNGDVIAHRRNGQLYIEDPHSGVRRLIHIDEVKSDVARAAVKSLGKQPGWYVLNTAMNTSFEHDDKVYQAVFTPFSDNWPWLLGIYVPEDDFLTEIKENRKLNILLALAITLVSVIIGVMFARSLSRPILSLQKSVNAVRNGELQVDIDKPNSMFSDIEETTTAFSNMIAFLKDNQEKNHQLTKQLSQQGHFMEAVLAAIDDGVVVCDVDGKLIYSSRVVMRLRGLSEDERLERFDDVPFKLFAADGKTLLSKDEWPIYRALAEEIISQEEVIIESALGVRKHLLISGKAIFDKNGEKLGAYISMHPHR